MKIDIKLLEHQIIWLTTQLTKRDLKKQDQEYLDGILNMLEGISDSLKDNGQATLIPVNQ